MPSRDLEAGRSPRPGDDAFARMLRHLLRGGALTTTDIREIAGVRRRAAVRWRVRLREAMPELIQAKIGREAALMLPRDLPDAARVSQAVGLRLAVDALGAMAGAPWHDALVALAASHQASVAGLGHLVADLRRGFAVVGVGQPVRDCEAITRAVGEAWRQRRWVTLTYRTLDGRTAARRVQIWGMILRREQALAIAAHRHGGRLVPRQYRIEDIEAVEPHDQRHGRPRGFDARSWLDGRWGSYVVPDAEPVEVVVALRGQPAGLVRALAMHPTQRIVSEADGWLVVAWRVVPCPELEGWLLSAIPDARVIAPAGLRERLRERVEAWRKESS